MNKVYDYFASFVLGVIFACFALSYFLTFFILSVLFLIFRFSYFVLVLAFLYDVFVVLPLFSHGYWSNVIFITPILVFVAYLFSYLRVKFFII